MGKQGAGTPLPAQISATQRIFRLAAGRLSTVVLRVYPERTPVTETPLRQRFELPVTKRQYLESSPIPRTSALVPGSTRSAARIVRVTTRCGVALQANFSSNVERCNQGTPISERSGRLR